MENSYGPTAIHKKSLATAKSLYAKTLIEVNQLSNMIPKISEALNEAGAPYIQKQ